MGRLILQSLRYYWRTNLAVIAGVATAVTVLSGALLVGDSVRGSLRDLVLQRLGATDLAVLSSDFFREALAADLAADAEFDRAFDGITPMIVARGLATSQDTGRRAAQVMVYGIDERFWRFQGFGDGRPSPLPGADDPASRDVLLSPALARELSAEAGASVILRVERPSDIPLESLHGRKDDLSRSVRLTVRAVLPAEAMGEFSLQAQQSDVLAAFVPLERLQQDLGVSGRVNALLVSGADETTAEPAALAALVRRHASIADASLRLRPLEPAGMLSLESDAGLIDDARAEAAREAALALKMRAVPIFTYLANTIRAGDREIPYSLVTAIDLDLVDPALQTEERSVPPIVLNDWAARDLGVRVGDRVTLEYLVWQDPGVLVSESTSFQLVRVVPMQGLANDRDLAPEYPGITTSTNLRDWDPPFPLDLGRIRDVDEAYWNDHRTTPKAFIPITVGQAIWRSRYGALTSIRLLPPEGTTLLTAGPEFADRLRASIDPLTVGGLSVQDVRAAGLASSRGATNFGEYFTYFSFFLVVSALVLAALFFKLGVEQRVREVGLLRAVGFTTAKVRRLFVLEGLVLATIGSAFGVAGAVGYGALLMTGLRTWWVDAVGTTALRLHVTPASLAAGALAGIVAAVLCIWWTLRALSRISERSLLAGQLEIAEGPAKAGHYSWRIVPIFAVLGLLLIAAGVAGWIPQTAAFFGAGAALLIASLAGFSAWLRRPRPTPITGQGTIPLIRLGARNAAYRPARSVAAVAVMASAAFILVSVDAFRRDGRVAEDDPKSGTGGYPLVATTVVPIVHDPNSVEGRAQLGLADATDVSLIPFRLRPGDDASCLNLYAPRQPRILGARADFLSAGRFAFQSSLDRSDEERENPWLLLQRDDPEGAIPVIADANSMTYVLHVALGDEIVIERERGGPVRLRLVAALSDSVLQSELVMSEDNFRRLFPAQEGYQFFFVDVPLTRADDVADTIEARLSDFGADVRRTGDRLAEFHRVENTYLSTFQTLGGLGLLLGTVGLSAVLLRNVLERRRELALLGAVGYTRSRLLLLVLAESTLILIYGLAAGVASAILAIAPAVLDRGGALPAGAGVWLLLGAVLATGLVASIVATRAAVQAKLIEALRTE